MKKRLFYMNITFSCNNNCIFCISHNTKYMACVNSPFTTIKEAAEYFKFTCEDEIIISGGEPTLSPQFDQILEFLSDKIGNIIVYTNGTNNIFMQHNIRWIFSIYGAESTHSYYTRNAKAFEIIKRNLIKNSSCNVEIKIILNPLITKEEFLEILHIKEKIGINVLHISCLCDSYNDFENRISFLSSKIKLFMKDIKYFDLLKISNIPLCISDWLFDYIEKLEPANDENWDKYIMLLPSKFKLFDYNQSHRWASKCSYCDLRYYCRDTNLSYRVLEIGYNEKRLIGE